MADLERVSASHELATLEAEAKMISRLPMAGALKGHPDAVLSVGIVAKAFGIDLAHAMAGGAPALYYVEDAHQVILSARLRAALALRAGHDLWWEGDAESCTAYLKRRGSDKVQSLTYTMEDAKRVASRSGKKMTENPAWKSHPADMLRNSAVRKLVSFACPDTLLGMGASDAYDNPPAIVDDDALAAELDAGEIVEPEADTTEPEATEGGEPFVPFETLKPERPTPEAVAEMARFLNERFDSPVERARFREAARARGLSLDLAESVDNLAALGNLSIELTSDT